MGPREHEKATALKKEINELTAAREHKNSQIGQAAEALRRLERSLELLPDAKSATLHFLTFNLTVDNGERLRKFIEDDITQYRQVVSKLTQARDIVQQEILAAQSKLGANRA